MSLSVPPPATSHLTADVPIEPVPRVFLALKGEREVNTPQRQAVNLSLEECEIPPRHRVAVRAHVVRVARFHFRHDARAARMHGQVQGTNFAQRGGEARPTD